MQSFKKLNLFSGIGRNMKKILPIGFLLISFSLFIFFFIASWVGATACTSSISNLSPANGALNVPISNNAVTVRWDMNGCNINNTYEVIHSFSNSTFIDSGSGSVTLTQGTPGGVNYSLHEGYLFPQKGRTYYWQIRDNDHVTSPIWSFATVNSLLTITKSGTGFGTVTSALAGINCGIDCSSDDYTADESVTLIATPDPGSIFVRWSGDTECASGNVPMNLDRTCTATFNLKPTYTLNVAVGLGTGSGTVTSSPAGISCGGDCTEYYTSGTSVTLTATPAAGSTFAGWSGNADCSDGSVTMNADKSCTATFNVSAVPSYTLTVDANTKHGFSGGYVVSNPKGLEGLGIEISLNGGFSSASFAPGTIVTLTATPGGQTAFTGWSGGGCSGTGKCTLTMNSNIAVKAGFVQIRGLGFEKDIKNPTSAGYSKVSSSPFGINCDPTQPGGVVCDTNVRNSTDKINCGLTCVKQHAYFLDGTFVTLTAVPTPGSTLSSWSVTSSGSGKAISVSGCIAPTLTCTVLMNEDIVVRALFYVNPTFVLVPNSGSITVGNRIQFDGRYDPDGPDGPDAEQTIPRSSITWSSSNSAIASVNGSGLVTGNRVGTATINGTYRGITATASLTVSAIPTFTLTITKVGGFPGTGSVAGFLSSGMPAGIACGLDCSENFTAGTNVTLTASPAELGTPVDWSGDADCSDGNVTMNADKTCIVTFYLSLNIVKSGSGTVTSAPVGINCGVDCSENYITGTNVILTATPSAGSIFAGWSNDADCSDGNVTMNVTKNCTATFNALPNALPGDINVKATLDGAPWSGGVNYSLSGPVSFTGSSVPNLFSNKPPVEWYNITYTSGGPVGAIKASPFITPASSQFLPAGSAIEFVLNFTSAPPAPSACSDGIDNDGDGRTDHPNDRGCESATDPTETMNLSCFGSPASPQLNQTVTWTANPSSGQIPYTYSWSGAVTGSTQQVQTSYGTTGTKTASITVTSGTESKLANCSVNVQSPNNPPTAVAGISLTSGNSATYSSSISVIKGTATTFYLSAWRGTLASPTSKSDDADGWNTFKGMNGWGAKCEWDTDLVQNPADFTMNVQRIKPIINNTTPFQECSDPDNNTSNYITLTKTFNDAPGTYTYYVLKITDAQLGVSNPLGTVQVKVLAQCENGIDDDGDGKTDSPADPGCSGGNDDDETDPPPSQSDLTASTPTPTAAISGPILFSSTITNGGIAPTGAGFINLFQISTVSSNGESPDNSNTSTVVSSLGAGANVITSKSITLTAGTYYMRVCADSNAFPGDGAIIESNDDNNCSSGIPWTTVTVTDAPLPIDGYYSGWDICDASCNQTAICVPPQNGGAACSLPAPTQSCTGGLCPTSNGFCAPTHYSCLNGNSGDNENHTANWTWTCTGSDGIPAQCVERKRQPGFIEG